MSKSLARLTFSILFLIPNLIAAGPTGGEVVGGEGSIEYNGNQTTIQQDSQRMAIDWQTYNLSESERVQYLQPGSTAVSLNRIFDQNPSQILGQIDANGIVFLVNPRGVFFGESATLNVGSLVASGLDIKTSDFMQGQYLFKGVDGTGGTVVNHGLIQAATGGSVALLGKTVVNEGEIYATLGRVSLSAGSAAVITFDADGLIGVEVTQEVLENELGVDSAVLNKGRLEAEGGQVLMTAKVGQDLFTNAVNNEGIVQATTIEHRNGAVFLVGSGGDTSNSGTLDVSATESGDSGGEVTVQGENVNNSGTITADAEQGDGGTIALDSNDTTSLSENSETTARSESNGQGGTILVLGDKVGLFDQSSVDASGANGGGTVLIGGDEQGLNPDVKNASAVYIGKDTTVSADAHDNGAGGKIIAYAGQSAKIHGLLTARGGAQGGDGGFIETSGKAYFELLQAPDVNATNGKGGTWLIDPYDINIVSGNAGTIDTTGQSPYTFIPGSDTELGIDEILTALTGGNEVIIYTGGAGNGNSAGDITWEAPMNYSGVGDATLTLRADNDILIQDRIYDGDLSPTDSLNINFLADYDNTGGGFVWLNNYSGDIDELQIETNGGAFFASGTGFFNGGDDSRAIMTAGGDITVDVTENIMFGRVDSGTGDLTATAEGDINQRNTGGMRITVGGATLLSASGGVDLQNSQNDFYTVAIANATTVDINDTNSIQLNDTTNTATTTSDDITITANDNITVTGTVNAGNRLILRAGRGDGVTRAIVDISTATINRNLSVRADGDDDLLIGFDTATEWAIGSGNDGSFDLSGAAATGLTWTYTNIENLEGGDGNDIFNFGPAGSVGGTVSGGAGDDQFIFTNSNTLASDQSINGDTVSGPTGSDVVDFSGTTGGSVSANLNNILNVENVIGDGVDDTLTGQDDVTNTWTIDAVTSVNRVNLDTEFSGFVEITGGTDTDIFELTTNLPGSINGGDGNDQFNIHTDITTGTDINGGRDNDTFTLDAGITALNINGGSGLSTAGQDYDVLNMSNFGSIGPPATNASWVFTSSTDGSITEDAAPAASVTFLGMESFVGTAGHDNFVLANGSPLIGTLDGESGDNTLSHANFSTPVTVNAGNLNRIQNVIGGTSNSDRVNGADVNSDWQVLTDGSVDVTDQTDMSTINFAAFEELFAGTETDEMLGTIAGVTWQMTGVNDGTVLGYSFYNFEELTAGIGQDTLIGQNAFNTWTIDGRDGIGSGSLGPVSFRNFENLTGNGGVDDFTMTANGFISGDIIGAGGDDILRVAYSDSGRFIDFNGGVGGNDTVVMTGTADTSSYTFDLVSPGSINHNTTSQSGSQTINANNIEQVVDQIIAGEITLTGSGLNDIIDIGPSASGTTLDVTRNGVAMVQIAFRNKTDLTVDGAGGTDTINFAQNIDPLGTVNLTSETVTSANGVVVTANRLVIDGTGGSSGLGISNSNPFEINVDELQLNNITGDVYLTESNGLDITGASIDGNLDFVNQDSNTVSATGPVSVSGTSTWTGTGVGGTSFILDNPGNQFGGSMFFQGSLGNIEVANSGDIILGQGFTATGLNLTASGDIIGNGVFDISDIINGVTQLTSTNLGTVDFSNAANNFNVFGASGAGTLTVVDVDDISLNTVNAQSTNINAGGAIIDNNGGGINLSGGSANLTAVGGIGNGNALETAVGSITVNNSNGGSIGIESTGSLTIAGASNTQSTDGDINISASGSIFQTGAITSTRDVTLVANNGVISMNDGTDTTLTTDGGTISYTADGDITISTLDSIYAAGTVDINSDRGSILSSRFPDYDDLQPNVIGRDALFTAPIGSLGEPGKPIVINVSNRVSINTATSEPPIYYPNEPAIIEDTSQTLFSGNELRAEVGNNQRTDVDALAIIDPAIFTEVKNFAEDDYPVKLPADQLFAEDEEEEEKKKRRNEEDPDVFETQTPEGVEEVSEVTEVE